jgi:hypothetical protein
VDAVTRVARWLVLCWVAGCAGAPAAPPADESRDPDAVEVRWGDEYDGVLEDGDLEGAPTWTSSRRASASLDALVALAEDAANLQTVRSVAASARLAHAGARYRESAYGRAGAVEVSEVACLRSLVVGAIRPVVGEGALVASARELGSPSPRATPFVSVLRATPSSSVWGSVLGAGATVAAGPARLLTAAWRSHDDDSTWTAWSGAEWHFARTTVGAAYGRTMRRTEGATSVVVSRAFGDAFVAAEVARAGSRVAYAARIVAGEDRAWRASLAGGAAAAPETPAGSSPRDRHSAVLERRDRWRGLGSRLTASSVARREAASEQRRRRIDWEVNTPVDDGASIEAGVRFTENDVVAAPSLLATGNVDESGEWRARVALRVRERPTPTMDVEHVFRIDCVQAGGAPGFAASWRGALRRGPVDVGVQASAWGLKAGQLGYLGRAGLPGASAFTTISGGGSDLSLMVRAAVGRHAGVAVEWRRRASGDEAVLLGSSLRW